MSTLLALPEVVSVASLATASIDNPKADFSDTPFWLSVVKALLIFVYLLLSTLLVIWFERRVIGRMQQRPGPNRNGPFGLLQTLADGMLDGVVWLPTNSRDCSVRTDLGTDAGGRVAVTKGGAA